MPKSVKQIKRMQHTENDRIFYSEFEVDEIKKKLRENSYESIEHDYKGLNPVRVLKITLRDFNSVFDEVKNEKN